MKTGDESSSGLPDNVKVLHRDLVLEFDVEDTLSGSVVDKVREGRTDRYLFTRRSQGHYGEVGSAAWGGQSKCFPVKRGSMISAIMM